MNTRFIYSLFLLLVINTSLFAQLETTSISSKNEKIKTSPLPGEQIYVHLNSSLFFVGEYLYYKVYVVNSNTKNLSELSKVAYLELINENKKSVFKQKIRLNSGTGQGDFFIPTEVPSGNYKIVSYTLNMLSKAPENYFQQDVSIINPYKGNQNAITRKNSTISEIDNSIIKQTEADKDRNHIRVNLITDKTVYSKRSPVLLEIKNVDNKEFSGTYSISVRKIDSVSHPLLNRATEVKKYYNQLSTNNTKQLILPELRGEILNGTITAVSENDKVDNQKVALSIPGDNFIFKISNVDNHGNFYFNIDETYSNDTAYLQVVDDTTNSFKIEVDKQTPISFENLDFNHFYITPEMKNMIIKRSVYNQIENGYYTVKPDTIKTIPADTSIYKKKSTVYNLDEYTRFPTIEETMVEIVNDAWINKRNGRSYFNIREKENSSPSNQPALLLVDGFFVQDHEDFINYKAGKVASISIMRDKYYYGSQTFQGVMLVETIEGNFSENISKDYIDKIEIQPAQKNKQYFNQDYSTETSKNNRIPDYRRQLFWLPDLTITKPNKELTFYTSDISGTFEISLEGFTETGNPVSIQKRFEVN